MVATGDAMGVVGAKGEGCAAAVACRLFCKIRAELCEDWCKEESGGEVATGEGDG